ncbi:MAG: hypothetical protein LBK01_02970 [Burkholderiaceae bacterium]|jgi:ribosomal protein S28E/S33|nr:hypothetical protein [Burkholderiaceae bacterium]
MISSIVDPLPTGGNPGDVLTRSDDGGTMWSIVDPFPTGGNPGNVLMLNVLGEKIWGDVYVLYETEEEAEVASQANPNVLCLYPDE